MKKLVLAGLCLLSVAAFAVPLTSAAEASVPQWLSVAGTAVTIVALIIGYAALSQRERAFADVRLWLLAAVLAGVATLAMSFSAVGTAELVTGQKLRALLLFAGRVPAYFMGMKLLKSALTAPRKNARKPLPTWAYALLLLVCWLPYLFAVWPGTVSNDSITQLAEIVGTKPLSNGNPVFQTALIAAAVKLGFGSADAAVAIYCCVQGALMAWLLGYCLHRIAESGAPMWLRIASLALYALCPVFPLFAFCMGKDTSFAMAVLWLALMAWRVLESKWPPFRTTLGLCLSAALCALLRNMGVWLAALVLASLLGCCLVRRTRQWRTPLAALATLALAVLSLHLLVLPSLAAEPTPEAENMSVPLQQVARVAVSEPLTDAERAAIDALLPTDSLVGTYNGELSDPVKDLWNESASAEQKRAFFQTWARLLLKHPATCLSATFHNGYGYLTVGYVTKIKPSLLLGMQGRTTLIDGAFDFTVNARAEALKQGLTALYDFAPFRALIAPGLYGCLTLFACCALLGTKRRRYLICALPALFTLIGCLFSAVNGYFRYAMPMYLAAPPLLTLIRCAAAPAKETIRP